MSYNQNSRIISTEPTQYLQKMKEVVLRFIKDENVKFFLFGSRARGDSAITSDVDIGIIPGKNFNKVKLTLLYKSIETVTFLEMTDDRNMTSHTYKEEVAELIFGKLSKYSKLADNVISRFNV